MSDSRIFGYSTTSSQQALKAFIAQANLRYEGLAEAIAPVDEKMTDLQKDWNLRPRRFWYGILDTHIPAIREAAAACFQLFDKKQKQATPAPIVISATDISYIFDLHHVESRIEEVGILLTASLQTPEAASIEGQIRERQRLLHALQELSEAVHKATDKGHTRLAQAPKVQARILAPSTLMGHGDQPGTARQKRKRRAPQECPASLHVVLSDSDDEKPNLKQEEGR